MEVRDVVILLILVCSGFAAYMAWESYKNMRTLVTAKEIDRHLEDLKELKMTKLRMAPLKDEPVVIATLEGIDEMIAEKERIIHDLRYSKRIGRLL